MPRTFVWHPSKGPAKTPKLEKPTSGEVSVEGKAQPLPDPFFGPAQAMHGATFVVDGNLRRSSPSSWRLSVRIDSATTGHCLWTERYEFPGDEMFAVQDTVCETVVAAAYPMLVAYTQAGLRRVPHPHELQTWELAHEGMRLCTLREAATNHRAQSLFRLAIEREPDLLLAHFGLGIASFDHVLNQWSAPADAHRQLLAAAERCVTLAPHGAEGHYLFGRYFQSSGEPALATRSLESAIQRNPSFAPAHALLAQMLQFSGRSDEAQILRDMLVGGRMIEGGGCGFNPKAPRRTIYPAGSNAPGALHFGIDLARPSDYIRRVMPDWEEPPVHMDLVTLDSTVTAGGTPLIEGGFLCALRDPEVVAMAARYGDPVELLETGVD